MRNILITGGAGSLGKAFVGALHKGNKLTVVDSNEWALAQLQAQYADVECLLMDFADWEYAKHPVDVVIHLAAYKHVDLGESNPMSFVHNNVTKTASLFEEAFRFGADIIFVSTDKAVEPSSLYGYTKAIGEKLCRHYGGTIARLGNILNSSGSVIPVWEQAIESGEPIPLTDERMTRYFIEDYDAVNVVWHDYLAGKTLIIPPMEEVRILDMLAEVLKRHGYESAEDYPHGVTLNGMRPGEKLSEKLKWDQEEL